MLHVLVHFLEYSTKWSASRCPSRYAQGAESKTLMVVQVLPEKTARAFSRSRLVAVIFERWRVAVAPRSNRRPQNGVFHRIAEENHFHRGTMSRRLFFNDRPT
jgi:hypothetical protein